MGKKLGGGSSNQRIDDLSDKFDGLQSSVEQLLQAFLIMDREIPMELDASSLLIPL